jgi:hypothetical protein
MMSESGILTELEVEPGSSAVYELYDKRADVSKFDVSKVMIEATAIVIGDGAGGLTEALVKCFSSTVAAATKNADRLTRIGNGGDQSKARMAADVKRQIEDYLASRGIVISSLISKTISEVVDRGFGIVQKNQ